MGFAYVIGMELVLVKTLILKRELEHMEEDETTERCIPPWVELEYAHMRTLAGLNAHLHFAHLSKSSCGSLNSAFTKAASGNSTLAPFSCHQEGISDLMKKFGLSLDQICLLDPKAEHMLSPEDGDGRFVWFLFGGILGDDPPRDRTSELRVQGFLTRHLGPIQMTTDTAVGVTKLVVQDKLPLDKIPYVDYPTIKFNARESVEMPFRYILENGQPKLPPGMKQLLQDDLNKGFEL